MTVTIESVIYLVIVALLWGVTNPFLKKGASGIEDVKAKTSYGQFFKEISFLVTNAKYMTPFLVNQCGSLLYFLTLQSTDLTLAIPVSNSLAFVVTAITGWMLGERPAGKRTYAGMALIVAGITLCCWDKFDHSK